MNHIMMLIYVTLTCLGVVTFCMTVFCKVDISRSIGLKVLDIQRYLGLLIAFFIINFLIYYNAFFVLSSNTNYVLYTLFDISLVIMLLLLLVLNVSHRNSILFKIEGVLGLMYIICWIFSRVERIDNLFASSIAACVSDVVFISISISILSFSAFVQEKETEDKAGKKFVIGLDIMTTVYLAALLIEDMYWVLGRIFINERIKYPYSIEPVFVLYIIENIFVIVYLLKWIKSSRSINITTIDNLNEASGGENFIEKFGITARETEVIELVAAGYSNSEIGEKLNISIYTVKRHINSIFKKVEVTSRIELLKKIEDA